MNVQAIIDESRLTHVRELQTAVAKLNAENARLRAENEELKSHLDFAILAARDLETLEGTSKLVIVDGWNLILGALKRGTERIGPFLPARDRKELEAEARAYLVEHPGDMVWLVLDGPRFATKVENRLRVSYTGGEGVHRADRFICDFLRMAKFRGDLDRIEVVTNDKDFLKAVTRLKNS